MSSSNSNAVGRVRRSVQHILSAVARKTEPRFVIVGSGRSGSGYISRVLTAAGIPCGHESWWNPYGRRQRGLLGDSSWCALAQIDWIKYSGQVFHQVRHPLDVISSYVHRHTFTGPFAKIKLPLLVEDPGGDPLRYACRVWLDLNRRSAELTTNYWRLEDIDCRLLQNIGVAVGTVPRNVESAIRSVSKSYNSHSTPRRLGWQDLPRDLIDEIKALAQEFGYACNERAASARR